MVFISSIVGALFQYLSIKLGVAGEVDLARACRDAFSPRVSTLLWILAEIGIIATDLSCVVGAALALKMVLGVSLISGLFLTIIDVLVVMLLERYTFRLFEVGSFVCFTLPTVLCPSHISGTCYLTCTHTLPFLLPPLSLSLTHSLTHSPIMFHSYRSL